MGSTRGKAKLEEMENDKRRKRKENDKRKKETCVSGMMEAESLFLLSLLLPVVVVVAVPRVEREALLPPSS